MDYIRSYLSGKLKDVLERPLLEKGVAADSLPRGTRPVLQAQGRLFKESSQAVIKQGGI